MSAGDAPPKEAPAAAGGAALLGRVAAAAGLRYDFLRFVCVGTFNTASGYVYYLCFLWLGLAAEWAYSASYILGVVVSYFLNLRFTFRRRHTWRKMATFPLVYVTQYCVGLLALKLALYLGASPVLAGLCVLPVTVPITFFTARFLLR